MNEFEGGRREGSETEHEDKISLKGKGAWTIKIMCDEKDDHTECCEPVTHRSRNLCPSLYKLCKQNKMLLLLSRYS